MSGGGEGPRGPAGSAGRGGPRKLEGAFGRIVSERAPQTLLAEVQGAWPAACGEGIAANSEPVAERDGVVTIACASGPWAQELELLGEQLRERIGALVGAERVRALRFTADLARHR